MGQQGAGWLQGQQGGHSLHPSIPAPGYAAALNRSSWSTSRSPASHLPASPLHTPARPQMMQRDFPGSGATLSGLGGVNTGRDAAEFILLGSNTVQVCAEVEC